MNIPSTINAAELAKLPEASIRPSYRLDAHLGSGCFMDPPGFPAYFIQHVYTNNGDHPSSGPESVIFGRVLTVAKWPKGETWETRSAKHKETMRQLYSPLPNNHPRVLAWARSCAAYFKGGVTPLNGSRGVSDLKFFALGDIKLMLDNGGLELERCRVADYVLSHYPTFPRNVLYTLCTTPVNWGKGGEGSWWERLDTKPTPDGCPGGSLGRHPCNGSWCQVCGWCVNESDLEAK